MAGESTTLSGASPDSGWQISGWTGTTNNSSTATSNPVTMPASAHSAGVVYTEILDGGTTYDDTAAGFSYSSGWSSSSKSGAYGGSYRYNGTVGSTVSFDFYGDDFSILYTGHTSCGDVDVYIDDVLVGTFSQYAAVLTYQALWDYPGTLSLDNHTLRLEHAGPGGTYISLDAVIISAP